MDNLMEIFMDYTDDQESIITQFYKPIRVLGKGAFSKVILAWDEISQINVAIKIINKCSLRSGQLQLLVKESEILQQLNHKNIVKLKYAKESKSKYYIIMEHIEGITLEEYIKVNDKIPVVEMTQQIAKALKYLHERDIVHRDLKPENILVSQNDDLTVIDFGLSAISQGIGLLDDNCGTLLYMAPEVVLKKKYNRSVDIWSLGVIVYNMLTKGQHPYYCRDEDRNSLLYKMKYAQDMNEADLDKTQIHFISRTAAYQPEQRMTADQCLQHPFLSGLGDINQPITIGDLLRTYNKVSQLQQKIQSVIFLAYLKKLSVVVHQISNEDEVDQDDDSKSQKSQKSQPSSNLRMSQSKFKIKTQRSFCSANNYKSSGKMLTSQSDNQTDREDREEFLGIHTEFLTPKKTVQQYSLRQQKGILRNSSSTQHLPDINLNQASHQFQMPNFKITPQSKKPPLVLNRANRTGSLSKLSVTDSPQAQTKSIFFKKQL